MRMRSKIKLIGAMALFMMTAPALAADLPPPPPPPAPPPVVEEKPSCFYLRGDIGVAIHEQPEITKAATMATNPEIDETLVVDGGAGCKISQYFRAEVTGGYRHDAHMSERFNDLDADVRSYYAMFNAYIDFGNWSGVVPYIGAGVGVAHHDVVNVTLPVPTTDGDNTDLAWAVYAGAAFYLSEDLAIDLGYRFMDLGKAKSGSATPFTVDDFQSHDFRIGVRWHFGDY